MLERIKRWAHQLKSKLWILYYSSKDTRVPWYAKLVALLVVGYAFSPIDLIPDFIPVLGFLDDAILLPLGIMLAFKLIPDEVFLDYERKLKQIEKGKPTNWTAGVIIIGIWSAIVLGLLYLFFH